MEFLLRYRFYLLPIIAALLIFALRRVLRYRKERKTEADLTQQQRRNEALTRALQNPMAKAPSKPPASNPLEISWDEKLIQKDKSKADAMMFELVELTDYSRRKYLFPASQTVGIGSSDDNQMVLFREGVAPHHCTVSMDGGKPCVLSTSGAKTLLHRGKELATVNEGGVFLNNSDLLELGSTRIEFRMFRA